MHNASPGRKSSISCAALLLLLLSLSATGLLAEQRTYSVGVVPQYDTRQIFNAWNPILEYLSQHSGNQYMLVNSPDIPTFEKQLNAGKFDFAYANPFQFLAAHSSHGYVAIVRDGQRQLQGIVVVNKKSGFNTPLSLQGKKIALPAPNALGASLMVRYEFMGMGIKLIPQFVKSHKSVYLQVATGRIPAGGGVQSTLNTQPESIRNHLKIIYRTQALVPHPLIAHPRISKAEIEATANAFLTLNHSTNGKALLANIPMHQVIRAGKADYTNISTINLKPFSK